MSQPIGFIHPEYPDYVCKLHKAIYGLKQAPRAWFAQLRSSLCEYGFQQSQADPSLFIYSHQSVVIFVLIYVDDIVVTSSHQSQIDHLISYLASVFPLKDLGRLSYFLGIEITYLANGIHLSQRKYICDMLSKANMLSANGVTSPMSASTRLSIHDSPTFPDPTLYRSIVGSLQYLSLTRPDIAFSVNKICQFMHNPKHSHWQAVKRLLRYLKQTLNFGILLQKSSSLQIQAFSDADWAGCPDDRRSTGGFCIFLGSNLVSWSSRKQRTVAHSSTEAEYKALANTTAEVLWLQSLLKELHIFLPKAPILWCDNLGATYLSVNPILHSRTKHMEIDFHFVRDRVAAKTIQVAFLPSKDQLADIFTKPIVSTRFSSMRTSLTVVDTPLGSRGRVEASSLASTTESTLQGISKSAASLEPSGIT
ncbi:uncharacterized mitochondrial protein AtMg00810-like [Juglans regia]|uniref:Uncharacterized mitochondrial protein AtMg00810-like n=1 Tax=Juglans regia TaxID=51240 RepID=A0A6P9DWK5_JUGRE|nr:uncharacterized mitochondrial protein AtMg00810-like [Juglans regia]